MMVRVYRKGAEIFNTMSESNTLNFPASTRIESLQADPAGVRIYLAEPTESVGALEPSYAERVLVGSGKFIYAIKSYRARTGVSLRDAKLVMDDLRAKLEREGERY